MGTEDLNYASNPCPTCEEPFDHLISPDGEKPVVGDLSVCICCTAVLRVKEVDERNRVICVVPVVQGALRDLRYDRAVLRARAAVIQTAWEYAAEQERRQQADEILQKFFGGKN